MPVSVIVLGRGGLGPTGARVLRGGACGRRVVLARAATLLPTPVSVPRLSLLSLNKFITRITKWADYAQLGGESNTYLSLSGVSPQSAARS